LHGEQCLPHAVIPPFDTVFDSALATFLRDGAYPLCSGSMAGVGGQRQRFLNGLGLDFFLSSSRRMSFLFCTKLSLFAALVELVERSFLYSSESRPPLCPSLNSSLIGRARSLVSSQSPFVMGFALCPRSETFSRPFFFFPSVVSLPPPLEHCGRVSHDAPPHHPIRARGTFSLATSYPTQGFFVANPLTIWHLLPSWPLPYCRTSRSLPMFPFLSKCF